MQKVYFRMFYMRETSDRNRSEGHLLTISHMSSPEEPCLHFNVDNMLAFFYDPANRNNNYIRR